VPRLQRGHPLFPGVRWNADLLERALPAAVVATGIAERGLALASLLRRLLCGWALALAAAAAVAQPMRFVHPQAESASDGRHTYYWQLLEAALQTNRAQYGEHEVLAYNKPMNFARAAAEVASGDGGRVNIVARATNLDLEARLRPVPIPLDRGLLGYRVFLILAERQPQLDAVRSLDELKRFSIGLSTPWTDVKVLEASGFKLVLANDYEGLFKMLGARRFELFSRGVNEVREEWLSHRNSIPGLAIERGIVLHYPMPRYFFVPRTAQGERMAQRLLDGLQRLARSGEFERRYQAYKRLVLDGIDLSGRRVFRLPNPQLSSLAPTGDRFWWDDLAAELAPRK
jgi:hypothetical protein